MSSEDLPINDITGRYSCPLCGRRQRCTRSKPFIMQNRWRVQYYYGSDEADEHTRARYTILSRALESLAIRSSLRVINDLPHHFPPRRSSDAVNFSRQTARGGGEEEEEIETDKGTTADEHDKHVVLQRRADTYDLKLTIMTDVRWCARH